MVNNLSQLNGASATQNWAQLDEPQLTPFGKERRRDVGRCTFSAESMVLENSESTCRVPARRSARSGCFWRGDSSVEGSQKHCEMQEHVRDSMSENSGEK